MNACLRVVLIAVFLVLAILPVSSQDAQAAQTQTSDLQNAESVVRSLYSLVTVKPGGPMTDWDKVRSLFYKDAVVVLRTSRTETSAFSVQGFIDDFVTFDQKARVQERGFAERIVRLKPMVFQDIAHILVLYEASMTDSARPPQQGIDSFHLMKKDGRWWIVSVVNEVPEPGTKVPNEFFE